MPWSCYYFWQASWEDTLPPRRPLSRQLSVPEEIELTLLCVGGEGSRQKLLKRSAGNVFPVYIKLHFYWRSGSGTVTCINKLLIFMQGIYSRDISFTLAYLFVVRISLFINQILSSIRLSKLLRHFRVGLLCYGSCGLLRLFVAGVWLATLAPSSILVGLATAPS